MAAGLFALVEPSQHVLRKDVTFNGFFQAGFVGGRRDVQGGVQGEERELVVVVS